MDTDGDNQQGLTWHPVIIMLNVTRVASCGHIALNPDLIEVLYAIISVNQHIGLNQNMKPNTIIVG